MDIVWVGYMLGIAYQKNLLGLHILQLITVKYFSLLMCTLIKKREEVDGAERNKSERLKEQQYKDEYDNTLDTYIVEWDEVIDAKKMWK